MTQFKKLLVGKQILIMFGTFCAVLVSIGAMFFVSPRSIERNSRQQLSYVVNETELIAPAAQNIGPMRAVIFPHLLAIDPTAIELVIAPQCRRPR